MASCTESASGASWVTDCTLTHLGARHAQLLADRVVAELREIPQHQRRAVAIGQAVERGLYGALALGPHEPVQRRARVLGQLLDLRPAELEEALLETAPAQAVDTVMGRDRQQPAPERLRRVVAVEPTLRALKCLAH